MIARVVMAATYPARLFVVLLCCGVSLLALLAYASYWLARDSFRYPVTR